MIVMSLELIHMLYIQMTIMARSLAVTHETIPLHNWHSTTAKESSSDSPGLAPVSLAPAFDYLVLLGYTQNHGSTSHDRHMKIITNLLRKHPGNIDTFYDSGTIKMSDRFHNEIRSDAWVRLSNTFI